jgi:uncharacterized ferritin-like protein (DUF455 family)
LSDAAALPDTLTGCAVAVLTCAAGREKADLSQACAAKWRASRAEGTPLPLGSAAPPLRPSRPDAPELLSPRDVPRRKPGSPQGRCALLQAVAHIELNAIDLHWDLIARFADTRFPMGFYDDWASAADDESKHFKLLSDCLEAEGSHYGAMPAHAGMWRAAEDTMDDLMGRLAVVPMVLEARGLDVTPQMLEVFRRAKSDQAVAALEIIYAEEVAHVAYGSKWFHFLCGRHELDPNETFHTLVSRYFHGSLKPPFNTEKRAEAGIPPDFYWPLTEDV